MKRKNSPLSVIAFITMVMLCVNFISCGGDDPVDDYSSGKSANTLTVSSTQIQFNSDGGNNSFIVSANIGWTITGGNTSWLTVSPQSGTATSSVSLTAQANTSTTSRSVDLIISSVDNSIQKFVKVTQDGVKESVSVSPTAVSLLETEGSSTSIMITSPGAWSISGCPDWLHMTATSGQGNTSITITAKNKNFSDEIRSATLTIISGSQSTLCTVSQEPYLAKNLRVDVSNLTVMSDGFACDLAFKSGTKGYREAFFTEYAMQTKTEEDIYNMLMEEEEYSGTIDWTYSPVVDPGTTIYYCVAAYGNENYSNGTHKYGAMSLQKITIPAKTLYADMYVTSSYTSTRWTATVQKSGTYGTRCQKYYYFAFEGDDATTVAYIYSYLPYAYLAHFLYKPSIKKNPDQYAISGQSFYYTRSANQFFFGVWGIDDNGNYSAEHTATYQDLSSSSSPMMMSQKKATEISKWNEPRKIPSKAEMEKYLKSMKVVGIR